MLQIFRSEPIDDYTKAADNLIILGDALKNLKNIKDGAVDLIFADPPYNLGGDYKKDFGAGTSNWKGKEGYINWLTKWINDCFRILSKSGTFYIMGATQYIPYIDTYIQGKSNFHILSRIIWHYDSSGKQAKKIFGSLYEPILMCTRTPKKDYTFNTDKIKVKAKTGADRNLIDYRKDPPEPYNNEKVPGNVWKIPRVRYKMTEYEDHPAQKPEKLLRRIILASSNPNDIVLDPFSGTFTTSAVALKNGRKAVGIEIEEEYYQIGLERTNHCSSNANKNNYKHEKNHDKDKNMKDLFD